MKFSVKKATLVSVAVLLSITVSGCSGSVPQKEPAPVITQEPESRKIKDFPYPTQIEPEFLAVFTKEESVPMAETGLHLMKVFIEDHPEFTVNDFDRTAELWETEITPKLKPLVKSDLWQLRTDEWMEASSPVLTSYVSTTNSNTWKSTAGENCTASDKPYRIELQSSELTARPDETGKQFPVYSSQVKVNISCQEGGELEASLYYYFKLEQENGKWLMGKEHGLMPTPGSEMIMVKK